MDPLTSSPARSPALPPRGAPVGGKTCPALHHGAGTSSCGARSAHLPHQPLPPMPSLVLTHRNPPSPPSPPSPPNEEQHANQPQQQQAEQQTEQELPNEDEYEHSSVHGYVFSAGKRADV